MGKSKKKRRLWFVFGVTGLILWCAIGATIGVGSYTFVYAEGGSYFSDSAESCANCHVMQDHYDAWLKSTHRNVASCNDCHAPHGSLVKKLYCKGRNGFFHSLAFTTGDFEDQILIHDYNRGITEGACRKCHSGMVHQIESLSTEVESMSCIRCHDSVGHSL